MIPSSFNYKRISSGTDQSKSIIDKHFHSKRDVVALGSISLQPASLILAYKQGRGRQEWMDWQNGFEATLAAMDHWSAVIDLTVWMKKVKYFRLCAAA